MTEEDKVEKSEDDLGPGRQYPNFHGSMLVVLPFTVSYCILGIWLLFDGWLNGFSSLFWIWGIEPDVGIMPVFKLALFSLVGSILGCGTLDIVSFHKYVAVKKIYDLDHIWGFFFSPILAAIIGLMVFALFQSGLLVFAGNISNENTPVTAELGFAAVGFLSGYSWHEVVEKFRDLSQSLFKKNENLEKSRKTTEEVAKEDKGTEG